MKPVEPLSNTTEPGEPQTAGQLLPLIYNELRALAARKLAQERPGHTLQPTALVHEAYQRLAGKEDHPRWDSPGHFYAAAAEAMRRILIESARRKRRRQARVGRAQDELLPNLPAPADPAADLLELDEVLTQFAALEPRKAELVKLRFYAGLSVEEAARALNISRATADRSWAYARAWLYHRLHGRSNGSGPAVSPFL
jgi:RNA polymerase sigma factor (TIGR02999 family)